MRFRLLGPLEFRAGTTWHQVPAAKPRTLLAALLISANRVVPAGDIADELWGDSPPRTMSNQVYGYVARLRKLLSDSGELIVRRSPGYLLSVEPGQVDAHRFMELLPQGQAALRSGDPGRAAGLLSAALDLWRGPALADVPASASLLAAVTRLEEQRLCAIESWAEAELACGRHELLVPRLSSYVTAHPLREWLWQHYLLALYRCGRQSDALLGYQQLQRLLVEELGVSPTNALQDLHRRILHSDSTLDCAAEALPLLPQWPVPRQLPPEATGFVGRRIALATLDDLLAQESGTPSLVFIGGMPGIGKSALAVRWSQQHAPEFPDGQLYGDLRGYSAVGPVTTDDMLWRFLQALGVAAQDIPRDLEARSAMYRSLMSGRKMLVLLDDAADVAQVRPLLPGSPECMVLVTSRSELAGLVAREGATRIGLDVLSAGESVELLTQLLGPIAGDGAVLPELAEGCAWLPLALRVTATNIARQPGRDLSEHVQALIGSRKLMYLQVHADREAAVSAAFDLSYQQLDHAQRRLFCLLALAPGASLDIAAKTLHNLGVNEHRLGHYASALRYCREAQAIHRASGHESGVALASLALGDTHLRLGALNKAAICFQEALAHYEKARNPRGRAVASNGLANTDRENGRLDDAVRRHEQARMVCRHFGLRTDEARVLNDLGFTLTVMGSRSEAYQRHQEALRLARQSGFRYEIARAHEGLGQKAQARQLYLEMGLPEAAALR